MSISQKKKLELNKDTPKNPKLYKIPRHIESCGTCMKY